MTSENTKVEFSIIRSVSYIGSKDSSVVKGAGKGLRYDYVTVNTSYIDEDMRK